MSLHHVPVKINDDDDSYSNDDDDNKNSQHVAK